MRKGVVFLGVVVYIALLCAVIATVLIYQFSANTSFSINMRKLQYLRYLYRAGIERGRFEIFYNPNVAVVINSGGEYHISNFIVDGVSMNVVILNDIDGDGFYDINVEIGQI